MNRDGANFSIWQHDMPEYKPVNGLQKDMIYDVLIVGGGITGITTALMLQLAGKRCVVAEAYNLGFGTTGGTTAHLNTLLDTPYTTIARNFGEDGARLTAIAARDAINLIEGFINTYAIDCDFQYQSAFLFSQNEDETNELKKIEEATAKAGVDLFLADSLPFNISFDRVVKIEKQAKFHPLHYIHGLARAFEKIGGIIVQNCPIDEVSSGEYFKANCNYGLLHADKLVYATHVPPGINLLHFRCAPYRSYAGAIKLQPGAYSGGLVYDMKDPFHFFRTQTINNEDYLIAGGFDHKTGHHDNTDHLFTELHAYLKPYFDFEKFDFHWSSQYFNSTDGLPYIGLLPGHDKTYTATGFGGNGMIYGTVAAMIISDLIQDKMNLYADLYSPSRIKPIAGFADFVKENADVVKMFVNKRLDYETIKSLASIANRDAEVVKYEGQMLGIYKDEQGKLHAINPVCTHAKCIVTWNNAEKSWDCPCHGGRFSPDGAVLTGPPARPLESIEWSSI